MKSVNKRSISEIFNIESRDCVYKIPLYQRAYTWSTREWDDLFVDLEENDCGYFLGSIICIDRSPDALSVAKMELVDGQQRLISISLLFAAIYDALEGYKADLDREKDLKHFSLKKKLILNDEQPRLELQIQNHNKSDYQAVLKEADILGDNDDEELIPYAGNRRIFRAYRYFQECIAEMCEDTDDSIQAIFNFLEKVNHATLVQIEAAGYADAYTLFESLNNRGIPLTAIDLIKNKLFAELEKLEKIGESETKIAQHFKKWNNMLENLGEDYSAQERFFRQYYNAFKDELKSIHSVSVATRSNLIEIYDKLIGHDAKACLKKLIGASQHYSFILQNQDNQSNGLDKHLTNLARIQGAPSYLLLLYTLSRRENLELDNRHLSSITSLLVHFFVRRNVTDIPPTRDLTSLFMAIIGEIKELNGDAVVQAIRKSLVEKSASSEKFKENLEGPMYERNKEATRFILCALAQEAMTKETEKDLWQRGDGNHFVWTIEHIFPQGENIPQSWIDMIAEGDEEEAKMIQQSHVHKFGNLTITGYNSTLGNKSFLEKRDRVNKQGNPIGYNNGLNLNKDMAKAKTWGANEIDQRTKKLVDQAMGLFQL